ncbi:hypothetical protein DAEQUDRAFT_730816 [Daedalea quercina L-15889]|uniref:Uncharacterized protein n=1 Tax=Daedalea quercina L-15889 TaxID=1314783 RepID=A0A165MS12_9APHY|nr:hypothetical protein DAEQUDRAFT_730816 [Daedalea quercina L-15889]
MASKAQAPPQGRVAGKKPADKAVVARYLSSTSASSSRAAATPTLSASNSRTAVPSVPFSKFKPGASARTAKPALQAVGQDASNVKLTKTAGHVSGPVPVRSISVKVSNSVSKNLGPSSSSTSLTKKTSSKEQHPKSVNVTRDQTEPLTTLDALQQAAQIQSWLFMSATLENSYAAAQRSAAAALEQRRVELSEEEADIADARVRFDAERLIDFYDELMTPQVASAVAALVQQFLAHEEACSQTLARALWLVQEPANEHLRITQFNGILDEINQLSDEATQLEYSIVAIVPKEVERNVKTGDLPEQDSLLKRTLLALLPVVRARGVNLECARAVVQSGKNNLCVAMRLQSSQIIV